MITSIRTPLAGLAGAVVALAVCAGTSAASAATPVRVPQVHERFTHQACPADPSTTLALEACAEDAVLAADAKLNRLDAAIVRRLPAAGQREFVAATRQWLSYRAGVARAAASPDSGGTAAPLAELGALRAEDAAHITALDADFTSASGQRP